MFDEFNKRCKLSDLTNYTPNACNLQERVTSNTYCKSKSKFEISEETIIRSIHAYDSVMGKPNCKAVPRLFYRQKPAKREREGRTSLCIVHNCVQSLNVLHTANLSHVSVTFQLIQRCGQFR